MQFVPCVYAARVVVCCRSFTRGHNPHHHYNPHHEILRLPFLPRRGPRTTRQRQITTRSTKQRNHRAQEKRVRTCISNQERPRHKHQHLRPRRKRMQDSQRKHTRSQTTNVSSSNVPQRKTKKHIRRNTQVSSTLQCKQASTTPTRQQQATNHVSDRTLEQDANTT